MSQNILSDFYDMLEACAATSSKVEKVDIIKAAADREDIGADIRKLLVYAVDPTIRFYIAKRPDGVSDVGNHWSGDISVVCRLLDALAERRLSGSVAQLAVANMYTLLGQGTHEQIAFHRILMKDLRAGFDSSTVNKAVPKLIKTYPYMRCSLTSAVDIKKDFEWDQGVYAQEKADGMFANIDIAEGAVEISSRQGTKFPIHEFERTGFIRDALLLLERGAQYHGELLVEENGVVLPREISNGVMNSVAAGGSFGENRKPVFFAWDSVPLSVVSEAKGRFREQYKVRFERLKSSIEGIIAASAPRDIRLINTKIVHSVEEAYAFYRELLALGKEGAIIKRPTAIWKDGTSKEQVKLKLEVDVDLRVCGYEEGNGKNAATFGSLICQTEDGKLEVCVSGLSDAKRSEIHNKRNDFVGTIVTVRANSIMYPSASNDRHSLFLPRFVEERVDKGEADTLERVVEQFASAVAA